MNEPVISHVSDTARWIAAYRAIESKRPDALFRDHLADRLAGPRGHAIAASAPWFMRGGAMIIARTKLIDDLVLDCVRQGAELVVNLEGGAQIALVTDAGMPGISDPGFRLIALAIRHHVPVVPIPGPSAFLAALAASGLPTDSFRFSGFLPAKSGQRRKLIESVKDSPRTQVFYEAPHRLLETLADVVELLGDDRHVVVAREVTKIHEEFLRGRAGEVLKELKARGDVKGEVTLLIAKAEEGAPAAASETVSVARRVREIMAEEKADEKSALKKVAKERGIGKSEAYREWQKGK